MVAIVGMRIENTMVPLQPEFETVPPENHRSGVNEVLVQSAIETWRGSKGQQGKGDTMFFNLAMSLRRAGMDFYQIENTLRAEAQYGRSPKERLAQIPSIMTSLRRYLASVS